MVLARCTMVLRTDGSPEPLTEQRRAEMEGVITEMAKRGLRTICISYGDNADTAGASLTEDAPVHDMTCCAIMGIKVGVQSTALLLHALACA